MTKVQKIIVIERGRLNDLCRAMNTSKVTVIAALKGRSNSDLARRIRYVAVREFGGIEYIHEPQA